MKVNVYTLNSFAVTEEGGNPAGIVFDAEILTEDQMKQIAAIVGFSETAFYTHSDCASHKVRFFTPVDEVDLCGHATIGAYYAMSVLGKIKEGSYTQETINGILNIDVHNDHSVMMEQFTPCFTETVPIEEVAETLNLNPSDLCQDLIPQVVSTGLRDLMVPIRSLATLNAMKPDLDKVAELSRKYHIVGYHIFTQDTNGDADLYCRNLAPLYGIQEEAATGTSNGALACYLYRYGKITKEQAGNLYFRQGYSMNKPSQIQVSLSVQGEKILGVKVGGSAKNLKLMEVEI